jgi:hypothetical protein
LNHCQLYNVPVSSVADRCPFFLRIQIRISLKSQADFNADPCSKWTAKKKKNSEFFRYLRNFVYLTYYCRVVTKFSLDDFLCEIFTVANYISRWQ